ncbi:MAG: hypothetical protein ACI906_005123 [Candidatus Latescibacterota bacterium]|jgi:hypothetical protein
MFYMLVALSLLWWTGCTNINQMHQKYLQGDEAQLERIMEIVARPDYPYATRRKAAQILGDIGDPRAVPVLLMALQNYEQRTTLKQDAIRSLGKIGEPSAATQIGHLLDRSLETTDSDIRMAAVEALGDLGGVKSAEILINALRYYDVLMMREEQRTVRGVFTGDEHVFPKRPGMADSTGRGRGGFGNPGIGGLLGGEDQAPRMSMFGTQLDPSEMQYNPTPEERVKTHEALVSVGADAVLAIEQFIVSTDMTFTLRQELLAIVSEIRGVPPAAAE